MSLKNKKLIWIIQIILGLILIFFGLNFFLQFAPQPSLNEPATVFLGAIFVAGYIFPIISIIFVIVGLLFIFHKYSALSALVLFPITLNIILFHIFLDIATIGIGLVIFILNVYLLKVYWNSYKSVFKK